MNEDLPERTVYWEQDDGSETARGAVRAPFPRFALIAASVLVLGGVAAVALFRSHGSGTPVRQLTPTVAVSTASMAAQANTSTAVVTIPSTATAPATSTPVSTAEIPTATVVPTATPDRATTLMTTITGLEDTRQFEQAAKLADSGWQDPLFTQLQAAGFARHAVSDWQIVLATMPLMPANRTAQEAYVTFFAEKVESPAKRFSISLSYLKSEDIAFQSQQYPLASYLFSQGVSAGDIDVSDRTQQARGYAIMMAIGWWYTQDPTNDDLMREGTKYLYTGYEIALKYGFGTEAVTRLETLFGPDRTKWPQEQMVPTPLLGKMKEG